MLRLIKSYTILPSLHNNRQCMVFLGRQPYALKIGFLGLVKQLLGVRGVGKNRPIFCRKLRILRRVAVT